MAKFNFNINSFIGGFAPGWFLDEYPSFGNKNMAGNMLNCDLINPAGITQGKGLATLTGDNITTLIKGLLDRAIAVDKTYGVGGNKLYSISSTSVAVPHIINHSIATEEDGEDVMFYQGKIYYSYNHSTGGDVGQLILPSTHNDEFMSTTTIGKASLQNAPHQMLVNGDHLFIANGRYISMYDGINNIFTEKALDLHYGAVIQSIAWTQNRLWISANNPDVGKSTSSVYVWSGYRPRDEEPSWEEEIRIKGRVSAIYVQGGTPYIFYEDLTGISSLGVIDGIQIRKLIAFDGSIPKYYQVSEYKGFLIWISGNKVYAFGAVLPKLPGLLFQLSSTGFINAGSLSAPFGTPMIASQQDTSVQLAQFSGFETNSNWKSLLVDISKNKTGKGFIEKIIVNFHKMQIGARVDVKLNCDLGTSIWSGEISHNKDGTMAIQKIFYPNKEVKNFRIEFDFTNGSIINNVLINNIYIEGNFST